ncbi:putative magnesium transporter NIPA4, partial [Grifola frondosa]
ATSSAAASTSSAASSTIQVVGIILAIVSGLLIGSSFVFKKKGLLRSQKGQVAGEGVAYLKSPLWWVGMTMMILGELCNFAAYAFVEAIVVTPMGALSVVICAILSSIFLKETLSTFGWMGCVLCIIGSVIIALNGPQESSVGQIKAFQKLFLAPGFLVYGSVLIAAALVIIFWFGPRYGKKSMLVVYHGGISVSVTTGLGSAIVTTAMGDNQFKYWFMYFLMVFVAVTLVTEVYYLNVALALFNTGMLMSFFVFHGLTRRCSDSNGRISVTNRSLVVTPTYYVIFTFFSILTTIVLYQGLKAPATQIITLVMGFLVICVGITILQLSKVDPTQIKGLDRRSTILLQAARSNTEGIDEKDLAAVEDPGMDALRGSFGTMGSIIRARSARRMSMSSRGTGSVRSRYSMQPPLPGQDPLAGMKRHQLYDAPMPTTPELFAMDANSERISMANRPSGLGSPLSGGRTQTIKFGDEDVVHSYHIPGSGDDSATHERRSALHGGIDSPKYNPVDSKGSLDETQVLTLPVLNSTDDFASALGLRTAPPVLSGLDTYHHPQRIDPFNGSPSSATLASFPSATSSNVSTEDGSSRRPHTHHFFTRLPSDRHYPRGAPDADQEESERLWHRTSDDEESALPSSGGVRLVPSSLRH